MMEQALAPEEFRLVKMMRALGNPTRFHILRVLAQRRTCICGEIVDCVPLAQSTVSKHLSVLKGAGLVATRREGSMSVYRMTCPCLDGFFSCIETVLKENLKEARQRVMRR